MARAEAEELANELLALVPGATYHTNGLWAELPPAVEWVPATSATFDAGVIAVGEGYSLCVWVEDED
jgi:hypothetical protein